MRFDVITLFPELIEPFLKVGVTRRAFDALDGKAPLVDVRLWQLRDFADDAYRRVDDRPYGGGPGMVMLPEPLARCLAAVQAERASVGGSSPEGENANAAPAPVILFTPAGDPLKHTAVQGWASSGGAVLICGRYEGVDQRFINAHVTHEISLGDFVLSGGEVAAVALLDAVARLQPGVLNDAQSALQDSFAAGSVSTGGAAGQQTGLLDSPHYTRPEVWRGQSVPEVLTKGNHAAIEQWRAAQRLALTQARRPDLLKPL
jgi:tRNA (guanine37-N1)-methyltransferase